MSDSNTFLGDDSNFRLSDFRKYNKDGMILLGDVHMRQHIDKKCCYSGSLIQQNKGESFKKGYILWNLEDNTNTFRRIKNDYGYVKVFIDKDGNIENINKESEKDKDNENNVEFNDLPKYTKLNIISKSTNLEHLEKINKLFTEKSQIIEKNHFFDITDNNLNTIVEIDGKKNNIALLTNKDEIYNILTNNIKKTNEKFLTKSIEDKIRNIINSVEFKDKSMKNIRLKILKFSNFMKYGENNTINFNNFNDFYAIFAKNSTGKSSIYDCIIYSIFGKGTRGSQYDLINKDTNCMETEIILYVNDIEYKITRKISRSYKNSVKTDILAVYENNLNITNDLRKTSKIIEDKICSYDEFIRNSIVAQHLGYNFMNLNAKDKVNYLSQISRIEVIKEIIDNCNTIIKNLNKEYKQKTLNLVKYNKYDNTSSDKIKKKDNIQLNNLSENINNKLTQHKENKNNLTKEIKHENCKIDKINKKINFSEYELNNLITEQQNISKDNMNDIKNIDILDLYVRKENLQYDKNDLECELETLQFRETLLYCDMNSRDYKKIKEDFDKKQIIKIDNINKIIKQKQKLLWNDHTFDYYLYDKDDINNNIIISNNKIIDFEKNIDNIKDIIKKLNMNLNKKIKKIEFDNNNYNDNINNKKIIEDKIKNIEEEINKHNESYKKLIDYKYDSKCKYCIENSITKQKVFLEKSINENNCKINKYKDELNVIEKILKKQESIKNQYDKYIEDIEKVNDVKNEIEEYNKKIDMYTNNINTEKYIIKDNMDILHKIELYEKNEIIEKEIKLEEDEIENIKNMICKEYEKYIDINKEYNEIINKINEFKIDIYKNDKEIDEIVIILEKYNKYKNEFNRSNIINKKIILLNDRLEILNKEKHNIYDIINGKEEDIRKLNDEIIIINTDKEIYKTLFDEIEKINKELHEYEIIKQYICNDDLTSKIYKNNIIPQIQQLINSILATCTTYQIEIHYDKDEIEIYKKENGSDTITNIDTCGGFERHTLNLLFRMIFSQISGLVRLNFLIIDECIDSCDINNKEKIKNIINYMKSKYKWGMIISHDYYVKDNFDKELTIQHIDNKPYINV